MNSFSIQSGSSAPCQPKGPKGVYTMQAKDLFRSPCTKYKDDAFRAAVEGLDGNSTFSFRGQGGNSIGFTNRPKYLPEMTSKMIYESSFVMELIYLDHGHTA